MGVDTRACCMFGIAFESMDAALNHLLSRGKITEDEAAEFEDSGEIEGLWVDWQIESCYSGSNGVLGYPINNINIDKLKEVIAGVSEELGEENLKLHNFVYWY